jgi:DNA-binding transcriptional ArsR family regulator
MSLDHLSQTFAALADPTRRAILARLVSGEATVTELAEPFAMTGPAVSKHLKVLEKAGLIAQGRQAQWRPRRIETDRLVAVDAWLNLYRPLWEERFDRMAEHLKKLQEGKGDE